MRGEGSGNLILAIEFQILAVCFFQMALKHAKCHLNGIEIAIFFENNKN